MFKKKNLGKKQTPPGPKRRKLDHTCFRETARLNTFFLRFFFFGSRCAAKGDVGKKDPGKNNKKQQNPLTVVLSKHKKGTSLKIRS